jgi:murein DD-endopeptidase MepM/ murein hydrolase activator NlpD
LAKIAKKYNIDANDIIEANKLASVDDIRVGENLIIPGGRKIIIAPTQPVYVYKPPTTSTIKTTATGQMTWPNGCYHISQYYRGSLHTGIDIACSYGTPIHAADSGRVIKAQGGWNGGYGNETIIDHGNGITTLYGHQSAIYVRVGDYVTKGQVIGAEGSTGRSTGPHLHFEVRVSGVPKNPLSYIR